MMLKITSLNMATMMILMVLKIEKINGISYTENDNCNDNTDSRQSQIQRSWGLKNPIAISLTPFNRKEHEYLPVHIQIFPYY